MNERLKQVRKHLKMTQEQFALSISIKRDSYASYETGRVVPSDPLIKYMCNLYNINEDWLRTGAGEMFIPNPQNIIEDLKKEYDLDDADVAIIEAYLSLSGDERKVVKSYIDKIVHISNKKSEESIIEKKRQELISADAKATEQSLLTVEQRK